MKNVLTAGIALVAGSAAAQSITFDANIEDFGDVAGPVFEATFSLGEVASIDSVDIELAHSWAADIEFTLTASDGSQFIFTDDLGTGGDLGDGGELLAGVATYTFVESGGNGDWSPFSFVPVPSDTYNAIQWQSGPFAAGDWTVSLADDAGLDDGAVGSITINYTLVPAPASAALLGLAGFIGRRRG